MSRDLYFKFRYALKIIVATLLIFFFSQIAVGVVIATALSMMGNSPSQIESKFQQNNVMILGLTAAVATLVIFFIVQVLHWKKQPVLDFLGLKKKPQLKELWQVLKVYGLYFLSLVFVTTVLGTFTSVDVNQQQELGLQRTQSTFDLIQIYVMLAVIPPIYEEILFRGFLYRSLRRRLHIGGAAVITCVLFGIAHLEYDNLNWIAAVDTFIFSGFLIYLVEKQKHLYGAMVLHALKNSIAFYVLFVR